jgi:hydroxypyruvate isomerase
VQYPWAASRPDEERRELAAVLRERGLACGCIVWAPFGALAEPHWVRSDGRSRAALAQHLARAVDVAAEMGADVIAVLGAADDMPRQDQRRVMAENLQYAGDLVAARGLTLGLEPMVALPNMALKTCDEAIDVIQQANHPAVKLIFDTGHVRDTEPDVVGALERSFEHVCLVQFADQPGRIEPGAGTLPFDRVLNVLRRRQYRDLVELEHGWQRETSEGELAGLARLRILDHNSA